MIRLFLILVFILELTACGTNSTKKSHDRYTMQHDKAPSYVPSNLHAIENAIPKIEPKSRIGNPKKYTLLGKTYYLLSSSYGFKQRGNASWYGKKFHGHKTSNGETYNMFAMTAAHKTLPLPTYVWVKNLDNGRRVIVRVNDHGPFHGNRIIDLSYTAAKKLDMLKKGTGRVEITAIDPIAYHQNIKESKRQTLTFLKREQTPITSTSPAQSKQTYLQLGAFSIKNNAKKLVAKLNDALHLSATIKEVSRQSESLFLVQLGPFKTQEEVDQLAKKILLTRFPNQIKVYH